LDLVFVVSVAQEVFFRLTDSMRFCGMARIETPVPHGRAPTCGLAFGGSAAVPIGVPGRGLPV
jgi:hypothetical protein